MEVNIGQNQRFELSRRCCWLYKRNSGWGWHLDLERQLVGFLFLSFQYPAQITKVKSTICVWWKLAFFQHHYVSCIMICFLYGRYYLLHFKDNKIMILSSSKVIELGGGMELQTELFYCVELTARSRILVETQLYENR